MMLEVVKFIKEHENWREILTTDPYMLRISEKDSLIMLNYTQGASAPCEIVNECRGLILDAANDYKVIRYSFYRFYNYGEDGAADLDFRSLRVQDKIDGSMVMLYWYDDRWHISTRSTFDCDNTPVHGNSAKTYGYLIKKAMHNQNINMYNLDKRYTHVFELVSPDARVIINYPETKLYYLMSRNNETYEEVILPIGCVRPRYHMLSNFNGSMSAVEVFKEINDMANEYDGSKFEGFVVLDKHNNRVKVKNIDWIRLHILYNNGNVDEERSLNMFFTGESSEFLSYFPEYTGVVNASVSKYERLLLLCGQLDRIDWKSNITKKQLAGLVKRTVHRPAYAELIYKAYDHRALKWFIEMDLMWYIKLFGD